MRCPHGLSFKLGPDLYGLLGCILGRHQRGLNELDKFRDMMSRYLFFGPDRDAENSAIQGWPAVRYD